MWPNLFVAGVAKAGTTTLHHLLDAHPSIQMSKIKEPHYFSEMIVPTDEPNEHSYIIRDERDYLALFDFSKKATYYGESSPSYFLDPNSPEAIYKKSQHIKVLVILRDPIARAFSHYHMGFQSGKENQRSFLKALQSDEQNPSKKWGLSHMYIETGQYADSISRYQGRFGKENVKILFYETAFDDLKHTCNEITEFLDLPAYEEIPFSERRNAGQYQGRIGMALKSLPFRNKIPKDLKQRIKNLTRSKSAKPKENEIKFLFERFRGDLLRLDRDLTISFYTEYFKRQYDLTI